jgi:peptidoglycan/LPS O-acetylase OafA/YrhL
MQDNSSKYVFGLDLLRAIAILLVVFSSLFFLIPNAQGLITQLMSISNVIGVEIFFVLSGFLLGRKFFYFVIKEDFNFKLLSKFWIRRWFRVLPIYYLVLLINIVLTLYIGLEIPPDLWKYAFFLQNFSSPINATFFYESWSVSIGEFTALIGPLFLYLLVSLKLKQNKPKLFFVVTLAVIVLGISTKWIYSSLDEVNTMISWSSNLKNVVIYRIDAVYYGVLAAYISIVHPNFWKIINPYSLFIGLSLFFILFVYIPNQYWLIETHTLYWNVWYLPLISVAIVLILPFLSQWRIVNAVFMKPVRIMSSIAYVIYIIHYSIVIGLLTHFIPLERLPKFELFIYGLVYLSSLILIGYLINRWFELPLMKIRNHHKMNKYFE